MFESLVRNIDYVSNVAKAVGCCALGAAAVWRGYDRITGVNSLYAMVLCVFFAFTMVAIAVSLVNQREQQEI